ncbi:hypothetical protein AVEN_79185-1, partial [Araneus ventricosus]
NDRLLWLWRVEKPSALRNQLPPYKLISSYQTLERPRTSLAEKSAQQPIVKN